MLNPAWRPAQRDNPTLQSIKHDYHQPAHRIMANSRQITTIPVIISSKPGNDDSDLLYTANALERQLNLPGPTRNEQSVEWRLDTSGMLAPGQAQPEQILILVDADLAALKKAYARLKALKHFRNTRFSVIMENARNEETARRYFRRLAMGSKKFLDLPLLFCGTSPERGSHFSQGIAELAQKVRQTTELYAEINQTGSH